MIPQCIVPNLIDEHKKWLTDAGGTHLKRWQNVYTGNEEAGLAEAIVRRRLVEMGVTVNPHEDGSNPQPDFLCTVPQGKFFIDVACIEIETAENDFKVKDGAECFGYALLTDRVKAIVSDKAKQCAEQPNAVLIAVGTFHSLSAKIQRLPEWLITGTPHMAFEANSDGNAKFIGNETSLKGSAFYKKNGVAGRCSVSGVLAFDFLDTYRPFTVGSLHPSAARPFDPAWLPTVKFVRAELKNNKFTVNDA